MRQFAEAHLVQDLARFGIAVIIALRRLEPTQHLQRRRRELRVDQHRLQGRDQAVAAEQGGKPRQSGRRYERHALAVLVRQAQGGHVVDRLGKRAIHLLVGRVDVKHAVFPACQIVRRSGSRVIIVCALHRGGHAAPGTSELIEQAAMPALSRLQLHDKAEPPVGVVHDPG